MRPDGEAGWLVNRIRGRTESFKNWPMVQIRTIERYMKVIFEEEYSMDMPLPDDSTSIACLNEAFPFYSRRQVHAVPGVGRDGPAWQ